MATASAQCSSSKDTACQHARLKNLRCGPEAFRLLRKDL
ncbi:hypothetical protein PCH70_29970 [Pseudomonas cichorii JBC1]|nr:hypothetical protein PCH70_29970 [Pseudomonas cichorii JBC1]